MFIVGIDIAKRSHVARIIDSEGRTVVKPFSIRNNCSGYNALLARMNKITNHKSEFILAMEAAPKSTHLLCPDPGHSAEAQIAEIEAGGTAKHSGEAGQIHPASPRFSRRCFPYWRVKMLVPHSGAQRPQHCVSLFWRYTDATQPAGRAQTAAKGPTRASWS